MSLPEKEQKAYLELTDTGGHLRIRGQRDHLVELNHIFRQNDIRCNVDMDGEPHEDELAFVASVDRAKVEAILKAYQDAKGS